MSQPALDQEEREPEETAANTIMTSSSTPPAAAQEEESALLPTTALDSHDTSYSRSLTSAQTFKEGGNAHFSAKRYEPAQVSYEEGLKECAQIQSTQNGSSDAAAALQTALLSNLAMVLLKRKDYEQALQRCHQAQALDPSNPKVYYRRALAREGIFNQSQTTNRNNHTETPQLELLREAMDDLRKCLELSEEEDAGAKQHLRRLEALEQSKRSSFSLSGSLPTAVVTSNETQTNGSIHASTALSSSTTKLDAMPSAQQQRTDVVRLLLAHATTCTPTKHEAYFLIQYDWWTDWCRHVDFFYCMENPNNLQERQEQILSWLPTGAWLVEYDGDEKKQQVHSEDSSDDDEEDGFPFPRQLDNSNLLLSGRRTWEKHWYPALGEMPRLKPSLTRSHDYEVLPREVYHALRFWYGEVTPPICRRVVEFTKNGEKRLVLPLYASDVLARGRMERETEGNRCGACFAPYAKARCKQCMVRYYCNRSCQESHWAFHKAECKQFRLEGEELDNPNYNNIASKRVHVGGRVGLHNLGNTCFMNSALICMSHATPLTRHFLSNQFLADVNTTNPLGTGGKLAMAYEQVIKELWRKSSPVSPTSLKRAIAMFAPRFAGVNQHDAQEFLAYLLDGLHEDLNRIRKAPYVVTPDVTGSNMRVAGAEAWGAHRRRNDSLVMDTFYGQFKSTCVCPQCDRVSVSFDAFNHVSLEIPSRLSMTRTIPVLLFPDGHGAEAEIPVRYAITVQRGALVGDLRKGLSELCRIPTACLAFCDVYEHSIYEIFQDSKPLTLIRNSDVVAAYEVSPYTNGSVHAFCHHVRVEDSTKGVDPEYDGLAAPDETGNRFGFPFMTSFGVESTCMDVWEQVWQQVSKMADASTLRASRKEDGPENCVKNLLQIRVVDNQGNARPVFLDDAVGEEVVEMNSLDKASILPPNLDNVLAEYLGRDCAERFLFLRLEWLNSTTELLTMDEARFMTHSEHPSLVEAIKKEKSVNGRSGVSLDQCFETFTRPERLDEHNKWYCSACKDHVQAMKTMELWRLPNILVVHLKRFEFKHALRRDKLDTFVECPLEGLDMTKHCASTRVGRDAFVVDGVPAAYDLFAVTNHYGRMGFGHYTAFARRWDEEGLSKEWLVFDDSSVQSMGTGDGVITPAAYVLFYRRRIFH